MHLLLSKKKRKKEKECPLLPEQEDRRGKSLAEKLLIINAKEEKGEGRTLCVPFLAAKRKKGEIYTIGCGARKKREGV